MKTRFVCHHDEKEYGHVEITTSDVAWGDIADKFYDFLLGCGFVLDREDLSLHFHDPITNVIKECDCECVCKD